MQERSVDVPQRVGEEGGVAQVVHVSFMRHKRILGESIQGQPPQVCPASPQWSTLELALIFLQQHCCHLQQGRQKKSVRPRIRSETTRDEGYKINAPTPT